MEKQIEEVNKELESIIDLLNAAIKGKGYITKRYSETDKLRTTAYDCLILRDSNSEEFKITFDRNVYRNRENGEWENANDLKTDMKFYEFNGSNDFPYYALIGAFNEEQSIEHYIKEVSGLEEDYMSPNEITEEKARYLLNKAYEGREECEKEDAIRSFNNTIYEKEPCLILIDGSLL